ncbi:MAG: T9SS type A sorting domain-containing protein [Ignavibacteria bacterium]|nr:T9SS type A sorting domain-containing protein [Ignavibacteria bacterium]
MKKLIITFLFLTICSASYSQWISNFSNTGSDVNISDAKGQAVTVDYNDFSYVTGYLNEPTGNNNIVLIKYTPSGDTVWVRTFNGNADLNDKGLDVCVDVNGNVYVTGYAQYQGRSSDAVVLKYSSNGNLLWVNQYSSTNSSADDAGTAITIDNYNNIYVTGYTTNNDGYTDIFVRKIGPSGDALWTKTKDGEFHFDAEGNAIAVSGAGSIYVTGFFSSSELNTNIAVLKYSSSGNLEWYKEINGSGNSEDKAWGIVVDESDNAYITGYSTTSAGNIDCYTARFSASGVLLWSRLFNGSGNQTDKAWGIVVDTDESVYITGQTASVNSNTDFLTVKYSSTGSMLWNSIYNGTGNQEDVSIGIDILPNENNIVVTGKSWGTSNNFDFATIKYISGTGNQSQISIYGQSNNSQDIPTDIMSSRHGHVIVTGYGVNIAGVNEFDSFISTISLNWGSEISNEPVIPEDFMLYQNYPNPFNPVTNFRFAIKVNSHVKLTVFDMLGRVVDILADAELEAGTHNITFNAANLPSGIYFYKLEAGSYSAVKKMTLVK